MRITKASWFAAVLAGAASIAHAQPQPPPTEAQARYWVYGAFLTQAVPEIMSEQVALGPELEQRLGVPSGSGRQRIYDALISLTDRKQISVRKATPEEIAKYTVESKRELKDPLFALRAEDLTLLVQYDMQTNAIPFVGMLSTPVQPRLAKPPVVERAAPVPVEAPAPVATPAPVPVEAPAPVATPARVAAPVVPPVPVMAPPAKPATVAPVAVVPAQKRPPVAAPPPLAPVAAPPPALQPLPKPTGPCLVKPVMSDEDLINCGARPPR